MVENGLYRGTKLFTPGRNMKMVVMEDGTNASDQADSKPSRRLQSRLRFWRIRVRLNLGSEARGAVSFSSK